MTQYIVFDGDEELATVETNPFKLQVTGDVQEDSPLQTFENAEEIKMVRGESVDGELSLHEDWAKADEEHILQQLRTIIDTRGFNILTRSNVQ